MQAKLGSIVASVGGGGGKDEDERDAMTLQYDDPRIKTISRLDIYRQRVFGPGSRDAETDNGMGAQPVEHPKRKWPYASLCFQIVFVICAENYTVERITLGQKWVVNNAVEQRLLEIPFRTEPKIASFPDIESTSDLKMWLNESLQRFVDPTIERNFNVPISPIRFTLRKVKMEDIDNETSRWHAFVPVNWVTRRGISPNDMEDQYDDARDYGAYREMDESNQPYWHQALNTRCAGSLHQNLSLSRIVGEDWDAAFTHCSFSCTSMTPACRCFTLNYDDAAADGQSWTCELFRMSYSVDTVQSDIVRAESYIDSFLASNDSVPHWLSNAAAYHDVDIMVPRLKSVKSVPHEATTIMRRLNATDNFTTLDNSTTDTVMANFTAFTLTLTEVTEEFAQGSKTRSYWPLMRPFKFHYDSGYHNSPGFVMNLNFFDYMDYYDDHIKEVRAARARDAGGGTEEPETNSSLTSNATDSNATDSNASDTVIRRLTDVSSSTEDTQSTLSTKTAQNDHSRPNTTVPLLLQTADGTPITVSGNRMGLKPPSDVIGETVDDWLAGGYVSFGFVALTVDFITHNNNYDMFTWTQLCFQLHASGNIQPIFKADSLKITKHDIVDGIDPWQKAAYMNFSDVMYLLMILRIILTEVAEASRFGITGYIWYNSSVQKWNVLAMIALVLHIVRILIYKAYLDHSVFTTDLTSLQTPGAGASHVHLGAHSTMEFDEQSDAFRAFEVISAYSMLFAWLYLVRYLNDVFPRIAVLMTALGGALNAMIFFMVVIFCSALGFVFAAYFLFGSSVDGFKTISSSIIVCIEMLFGEVTYFVSTEEKFGMTGLVYFLCFILWLLWLQNISKAVILASYQDATLFQDDATPESGLFNAIAGAGSSEVKGHDLLAHIKKCLSKVLQGLGRLRREAKGIFARPIPESRTEPHPGRDFMIYLAFLCIYMGYLMIVLHVDDASKLTHTMTTAISTPEFHSMAGGLKNYHDIESSEDVESYLLEVIPKVMFNSSNGDFAGDPNPLKLYYGSLPTRYKQLVVNHWNIIQGQNPVRITTQFYGMEGIQESYFIEGVNKRGEKVLDLGGLQHQNEDYNVEELLKDFMVTDTSGILTDNTRDTIGRNCVWGAGYGATALDDYNGFVCMLSVDYGETMRILTDLVEGNFITNQTAMVAVDFVIFNGYAELNLLVGAKFTFHPSGAVEKEISTEFVKMALFDNWEDAVRLLLEVLLWALNCFYAVPAIIKIYRAVRKVRELEAAGDGSGAKDKKAEDKKRKGKRNKGEKRKSQDLAERIRGFFDIARIVIYDLVVNPFTTLDLLSSFLCIIALCTWHAVEFAPFRGYYFPERPFWNTETCAEFQVCPPPEGQGDADVITHFTIMGQKMRWFMRVGAMNTILIFIRLLRYAEGFVNVRRVFLTLRASAIDTIWYVITLMAFLLGYVNMGCLLFGTSVYRFRNKNEGFESCFEMVVGTFPFGLMRDGSGQISIVHYLTFTYTFIVIVRYMLTNIFFAILLRRFKETEERMREQGHLRPGENVSVVNLERRKEGCTDHLGHMHKVWFVEDSRPDHQPPRKVVLVSWEEYRDTADGGKGFYRDTLAGKTDTTPCKMWKVEYTAPEKDKNGIAQKVTDEFPVENLQGETFQEYVAKVQKSFSDWIKEQKKKRQGLHTADEEQPELEAEKAAQEKAQADGEDSSTAGTPRDAEKPADTENPDEADQPAAEGLAAEGTEAIESAVQEAKAAETGKFQGFLRVSARGRAQQQAVDASSANIQATDSGTASSVLEASILPEPYLQNEEVERKLMQAKNWNRLPKMIQSWAVQSAQEMSKQIKLMEQNYTDEADDPGADPDEIIMRVGEAKIKELIQAKLKDCKKIALALKAEEDIPENLRLEDDDRPSLEDLQNVYQEQQQMAMKIIERERLLQKLEDDKTAKKHKLEKIRESAKALIRSTDETEAGATEAIEDGGS